MVFKRQHKDVNAPSSNLTHKRVIFQVSKEGEVVVVRGETGGAGVETEGAEVVLLLLTLQPVPSHKVGLASY